MQVKRINENTIRVRIDKNELSKRGLKVLDLLGDKNKIQQFFYSILEEIDNDHSFSQDAPVTFQVMPNNGGLDLLITKVTKQDRAELSQLFDSDLKNDNPVLNKAFEDLESDAADDDENNFTDEQRQKDDENSPLSELASSLKPKTKKSDQQLHKRQAYSFSDLNQVTELAESVPEQMLLSSLYFEREYFYLDLAFKDDDFNELKPAEVWSIANEYGVKVRPNKMARIRTTGKCLIKQDALEILKHYFSHSKN
ncbi:MULTISPECIES: adaptor protein MecA [unclassified Lactobacillus]|uniref:adaptor protein MecA n=1 Tax=unclassified Lactobacillus TaxID=2620435 RepID=UPI000EFCD704|nr:MULTISPECIES: adaptor protein MecA [unclassified Lactobacillus]RMC40751.1 adaptor protein MecA [Lactobacillus sp. ESL0237]RMC44507.1 adaptor protein MecA [Lactobacillus sp. ESL0234]RMC45814.1 adaptor protein MecA [Lactobacillus sp. ESL0236]RMC51204.1 adaptor protein MecA [Lactobacillus sp. ESL0225]